MMAAGGSRAWRWAPSIAYMGAIFALSSLTAPPRLAPDAGAHLVEYAGLGFLLARAMAGERGRMDARAVASAWVMATAYGATDELHQSFVPGRHAELKDLGMDALGAGAGAALAWLFGRERHGQGGTPR